MFLLVLNLHNYEDHMEYFIACSSDPSKLETKQGELEGAIVNARNVLELLLNEEQKLFNAEPFNEPSPVKNYPHEGKKNLVKDEQRDRSKAGNEWGIKYGAWAKRHEEHHTKIKNQAQRNVKNKLSKDLGVPVLSLEPPEEIKKLTGILYMSYHFYIVEVQEL